MGLPRRHELGGACSRILGIRPINLALRVRA